METLHTLKKFFVAMIILSSNAYIDCIHSYICGTLYRSGLLHKQKLKYSKKKLKIKKFNIHTVKKDDFLLVYLAHCITVL